MAGLGAARNMVLDFAVGTADTPALHIKDDIIAGMLDGRCRLPAAKHHVAHRDAAIVDHGLGRIRTRGKAEDGHCQHRQSDAERGLFHGTVPSVAGETLAETGLWASAAAACLHALAPVGSPGFFGPFFWPPFLASLFGKSCPVPCCGSSLRPPTSISSTTASWPLPLTACWCWFQSFPLPGMVSIWASISPAAC